MHVRNKAGQIYSTSTSDRFDKAQVGSGSPLSLGKPYNGHVHGSKGGSGVARANRRAFFYFFLGFFTCAFVMRPASDLFLMVDMAMSQKTMEDIATFGVMPGAPVSVEPYTPVLVDEGETTFRGIHIVRSRYQQGQPRMMNLGWARLELFREFCLPSMLAQTTDNFVWLIYTDPELHPDLLAEMVRLLAPHPRFFLIASMQNVLWKVGQAQNMTQAVVYTGNRTLLEHTMAIRDVVPILETRLDADDALHIDFLKDIQTQATQFFYKEGVKWMYWCIEDELQWYWLGPNGMTKDQKEIGITESLSNKNFCPTPGLTLGYNVGVPIDMIYRRKHSLLIQRLTKKEEDMCGVGRPGKDCIQIIRQYPYPAMRTRTPTSSSMIMVEHDSKKLCDRAAKNDTHFDLLHNDFGIPRENCARAVTYLNEHIHDIAQDAILGTADDNGIFVVPDGARERLERMVSNLMAGGNGTEAAC